MKSLLATVLCVISTHALAASPIDYSKIANKKGSICITLLTPEKVRLKSWSFDENSVQAVLYKALRAAYLADRDSEFPERAIRKNHSTFYVMADSTKIVCRTKASDGLQIPQYSCEMTGPIENPSTHPKSVAITIEKALRDYAPISNVSIAKSRYDVIVARETLALRCKTEIDSRNIAQRKSSCSLYTPARTRILEPVRVRLINPAAIGEVAKWSTDALSVQAVLFKSIEKTYIAGLGRDLPRDAIVKRDNAYIVSSRNAKLTCWSKSGDLLAVQSYSCLFDGTVDDWSQDSSSVQALLYNSLYDYMVGMGANSGILTNGESLSVTNATVALKCTAKSLGMATVQSYSCELN